MNKADAKNINGIANPPIWYNKAPNRGPINKPKPFAASAKPRYLSRSWDPNEVIIAMQEVLIIPLPIPPSI